MAPTLVKGVSFSPKSTNGSDLVGFFTTAQEAGQMVTWAGDWAQLNGSSSAPTFVAQEAAQNNLSLVVEAQFFSQSDGSLLRPLDNQTQQDYIQWASSFAKTYKPAYMAFGIEVNILAKKSPSDYSTFVAFFPSVYAAVKTASPTTQVFTIFQLEQMKGLNGGLYGGSNDPASAQWSLLSDFGQSDLVGFTTYPGLIYSMPSDIPAGYYAEISNYTAKPVAFTEMGWQSNSTIPGWQGSEQDQATFVTSFVNMTKPLHPVFAIWSFLYDQNAPEPFTSMGLFTAQGTPKEAWSVWTAIG